MYGLPALSVAVLVGQGEPESFFPRTQFFMDAL